MTHHNSRAARGVAITSALLLVLASAGFGALFAWTTGSKHGLLLGALFVAMALGLEGAKPFAVAGAFNALSKWRLGQGLALASVGALAVLFSVTAELSLMATARGDLVASRSGEAGAAKKAEARYARAETELASLAPARPAAELAPQISKLKATPGANGCDKVDGKISRDICGQVADLEAEAARDARRRELEATMRGAEAERSNAPAIVAADPGATALSAYASTVGIEVAPELLSIWLPLIGVLALEIGSAFSVLIVRATDSAPALRDSSTVPQVPQIAAPQTLAIEAPQPVPVPQQPPAPQENKTKRPKDDGPGGEGSRRRVLGDLLGRLKDEGGEITATSRGLAELLKTSKGTCHRAVSDAVAAGLVRVAATAAGTRIALA